MITQEFVDCLTTYTSTSETAGTDADDSYRASQ